MLWFFLLVLALGFVFGWYVAAALSSKETSIST